MTTLTKKNLKNLKKERELDGNMMTSQVFAQVFHAFMECSDEIQQAIREMCEIVNDPEATDSEIHSALLTISDALFPCRHNGTLGIDLKECEEEAPDEIAAVLGNLDEQEATFAQRVDSLLREKQMTQGDLAVKIGIGQPAISMMLSRQCRPQRRTVEKIAEALGVAPSDLWPEVAE